MISIVICTYRRPQFLRRTLDHLSKIECNGLSWEVVVVDNAGCGETRSVTRDFSEGFPSLRYVVESRAGVAHARNCGWREALGEIVAYLDDDCLVDPDWLVQIDHFFSTGPGHDPLTGLVGGRILLLFENTRPAWLSDSLLGYLSQIDWGEEIESLRGSAKWIGEGNLAVRRGVLEMAGGFPVALGRRKKSLLGHEGNALREALEQKGYATWYNGAQRVRHIVFEERIASKRWLRRRAFWGGVSESLCLLTGGTISHEGKWRRTVKHLRLVCSLETLRRIQNATDAAQRLETECEALFRLGYAVGLSWRIPAR